MLSINSNIASLNAQRNLSRSEGTLKQSLERLSSGMRINSARDDAAGLAISERMTSTIRGLNQSARNASDGISMAQTVEGSLGEMTNNLQRIRELAVQSANATNSASDRSALNVEVQERLAEIQRIAEQTNFNGRRLLDGSSGVMNLQIGAGVGETIGVDLSTDLRTSNIGGTKQTITSSTGIDVDVIPSGYGGVTSIASSAQKTGAGANSYVTSATDAYTGVSGTAFNGSNFSLNGSNVADSSLHAGSHSAQDSTSAYAKAAAINASDIDGIAATAVTELSFGTTGGTGGSTDFLAVWTSSGSGAGGGYLNYDLSINGTQVIDYDGSTGAALASSVGATTLGMSMSAAVDAINDYKDTTGVEASLDSDGNLQLVAADGRNIRIEETFVTDVAGNFNNATARSAFSQVVQPGMDIATSNQDHTYRGELSLTTSGDLSISGTASAAGFTGSETLTGTNLQTIDVLDVNGANAAIDVIDTALTTLANARSTFGAVQNRLDSTISNINQSSESMQAARSRILDADFAIETAQLTRSQILQQAGIAMLSQANSLPQNVLSLLQ